MKKKQPSPRIKQLLIGFFKDTLSYAELDELEAWTHASEENEAIFQEWVDKDDKGEPLPTEKTYSQTWVMVAFAAGIFLAMSGTELNKNFANGSKQASIAPEGQRKRESRTVTTLPNEQITILMSDSTKVALFGGSSFEYPTPLLPDRRIVDLKGDASFEVKNDPEKRLRVNVKDYELISRNGNFTVHSSPTSDSIQLSLTSGDLMFIAGKNSWILEPGKTAVYSKGVWKKQ